MFLGLWGEPKQLIGLNHFTALKRTDKPGGESNTRESCDGKVKKAIFRTMSREE